MSLDLSRTRANDANERAGSEPPVSSRADRPSLEPSVGPRRKVRVLFIADSARNGGQGRSLYYTLKFLDPALIHRTVLLPREGMLSELYGKGGVTEELLFEQTLVE